MLFKVLRRCESPRLRRRGGGLEEDGCSVAFIKATHIKWKRCRRHRQEMNYGSYSDDEDDGKEVEEKADWLTEKAPDGQTAFLLPISAWRIAFQGQWCRGTRYSLWWISSIKGTQNLYWPRFPAWLREWGRELWVRAATVHSLYLSWKFHPLTLNPMERAIHCLICHAPHQF